MKNLLKVTNGEHFSTASLRTAVVLFIGVALASTFWTATTPVAQARDMTPREMIESKLPKGKNLITAAKPELLSAICAAVRKWPHASPQIVKAAVEARKPFAGDIVGTALRCSREDKGLDCGLITEILVGAFAVDPDDASAILDVAFGLAPGCRDAIAQIGQNGPRPPGEEGNFTNNPTVNQNPPPGTLGGGGGGGFNPEETRVIVCDNGTEVSVFASQLVQYLATHSGAFAGACVVTPATNQ